MKATGIVRKIDSLGRLVLPIELRSGLGIGKDDSVEIYTAEDMIILKKYAPSDIFTGDMDELVEYKGKKVSKRNIKELAKLAGLTVVEDSAKNESDVFKVEKPF